MTKTEEIRKVLQQQNADAAWITTHLTYITLLDIVVNHMNVYSHYSSKQMAKMFYFVRKWRLKKSKLHLSTGKSLVI